MVKHSPNSIKKLEHSHVENVIDLKQLHVLLAFLM